MTLLERCNSIFLQVEALEAERRLAHERSAIQHRHREWTQQLAAIEQLQTRLGWFGPLEGPFPWARAMGSLRRLAGTARERLDAEASSQSLVNDDLWARLLKTAENVAQSLQESVAQRWRAFVSEVSTFDAPDRLAMKVRQTPSNMEAMKAYRFAWDQYQSIAARPAPNDPGDFDRLREASVALSEAFDAINFQVSEAVDRFYRAAIASGASLDLLTDEVKAWLVEENQEHRYVIRVRN